MTTMVRWDPFRELDLMDRSMLGMPLMRAPVHPAADIYETEDEYVVELEVPGYGEQELTIEVFDHMLTVKGEHEATTETKEKIYRLQERLEQEFQRRFELPKVVDTDRLTATFKQGVLELHAPKVEAAVPKKIPVGI